MNVCHDRSAPTLDPKKPEGSQAYAIYCHRILD